MDWSILKFWEQKSGKITAYFIDEANGMFKVKKKYTDGKIEVKYGGENHTYLVNPKKIIRMNGTEPTHIYELGNAEPLDFRGMDTPELGSVGFTKILEDKVVRDLFSSELDKKLKLLLILVVVSVGVSALTLMIQMGIVKIGGGP